MSEKAAPTPLLKKKPICILGKYDLQCFTKVFLLQSRRVRSESSVGGRVTVHDGAVREDVVTSVTPSNLRPGEQSSNKSAREGVKARIKDLFFQHSSLSEDAH